MSAKLESRTIMGHNAAQTDSDVTKRIRSICGDGRYSSRSASVGFTFHARQAVMKAAASAAAVRNHCGRRDGRRIGGSDPEQLALDEPAESGNARKRNGNADADHDDGVAQDEPDRSKRRRWKSGPLLGS